MKNLLVSLCMLLAATVSANAQACPGGFWGNGQCIAPCESPLINPNVSLAFYGFFCSAQPPCENNYIYCYPAYSAYDNAYNQTCGIVTDWGDGGCYELPPGLNQLAPKRREPSDEPMPFWQRSGFKLSLTMRQPVHLRPMSVKQITLKNRFWWKHASNQIRL